MAIDYAQMTNGSQDNLAAARAPVVSFERVKPKRLTKKSKGALLRGRNVEKKMAKKKRTAKQEAATRKLIAYNRRKARGGTTKRKTVRSRGRRASAAAVVMAREPSTAIVKYEHPTRVAVTKKPRKKSGKSGSRSKPRRTAKQKEATKKLIAHNRSRSSGKSKTTKKSARKSPRRGTRGRRRARAVITVSASERKGRRRSRRRRTGPMENPMTGVELFIGTITGLLGFGTADVVDRIIATHPLTGVTSGTVTDVPPTANPAQGTRATYGSLFNSTAVCAPMNLERWGVGLLISGVPILIGHFVSAPVGRSSLQFFGFGALMRVAGKGLIDLVANLSKSNQTGMRLYSGEQRAAAVLANDGTVANLPANAVTGLGNPRIAALGAPPVLAMHKTGCGCGKCAGTGTGYPSMPAPQMNAAPVPTPPALTPPVASTQPTTDATFVRGVPRAGFTPRPGMYNWGENAKAA
jgi:hypothetical protein